MGGVVIGEWVGLRLACRSVDSIGSLSSFRLADVHKRLTGCPGIEGIKTGGGGGAQHGVQV